ncbi:MAG TPA: efflux RND transporter periplasmic adaptor subunit, partial [Thiohalobacter sp.]|nr:efflux RND transporter periplasmic adaptor subunit [Thiohalobacter sp.]
MAGLLGGLTVIVVLVGMRVYDRLQPLPPPVSRPLAVETHRLDPQPFIQSLRATGTLEAERRVVLSAQLAARVESVPWREGARVAEGEVLVQLDESEPRQEVARLEAALDRVRTDLAFWRKQLESDRQLLDSQSISRRAFDETRRQVDSLEAALRETRESLQSARIRLDYATVRAPFTGYIQTVRVLPGETVQPGMALLEVLAARPLKAIVPVPETDLPKLREGQGARLRVPVVNESWPARIDRLYPGLERDTRSATLELFLPADTAGVRPGMAVEASIEIARREDVLVIPQQALRQRQGGAGVFVLAE